MRWGLVLLFTLVAGLFEEQVGEFDWYHAGIGKVTHVLLSPSKRTAYVATQESVVAALHMKTGAIIWRQALPEGETMSNLKLFRQDLLTVSESGGIHRLWCRDTGILLWEDWTNNADKSLSYLSPALRRKVKSERRPSGTPFDTDVVERGAAVPQVITLYNDTVTLRESEGQKVWSWLHNGGPCLALFTGGFVLCSQNGQLVIICMGLKEGKCTSENKLDIPAGLPMVKSGRAVFCLDIKAGVMYVIDASGSRNLTLPKELLGDEAVVLTDIGLTGGFLFERDGKRFVVRAAGGCASEAPEKCFVALDSEVLPVDEDMLVLGQATGEIIFAVHNKGRLRVTLNKPGTTTNEHILDSAWLGHGRPQGVWGDATREEFLVVGEDHSLSMIKAGGPHLGPVWTREEALASVEKLIFIDLATEETASFPSLPVRIAGTMKSLAHIPAIINSWFIPPPPRAPFQNEFSQILPLGTPPHFTLEKDTFGFRKVMVIATEPGKLIGMDSETGTILWTHFLGGRIKDIVELKHTHAIAVTTTKAGTQLHHFDPLTGSFKEDAIAKPYRATHVLKLPMSSSGLHVALVMDSNLEGHVLPDTPDANAHVLAKSGAIFFFRMAINEGTLTGYGVVGEGKQLKAYERWKIVLPQEELVSAIASRDEVEVVQTSLRITGDATFMRKYVNANLIALATVRKTPTSGARLLPTVTKGTDPCVNIYIIDAVSGRILEKLAQRGGTGPVGLEVTENTVVFQYWNGDTRQHEVSVVDLYEEPVTPPVETRTNFSAFKAELPFTQQQSYFMRVGVSTISVTQTARGISSKLFLLGLTTGQILGVGRAILDPQRPTGTPSEADKFQGLLPYTPEIIVDPTAILNYNRTVHNLRGIVTCPVLLESTSLVFAYGLDLFHTRAQGSGAFDLLNEDFNYPFLILSVTSVAVGILISRRVAAAKALKTAWK